MKLLDQNPNNLNTAQLILAFFFVIESLAAIITGSSVHTFIAILEGVVLALSIYRRML